MKSIVHHSIILVVFFGSVYASNAEFNTTTFANKANDMIQTLKESNYKLTYLVTEHNAQLNVSKITHKTKDMLNRIGIDESHPEYNVKFDDQLMEFIKSRTDVFRLHRLINNQNFSIIEYRPISFDEATNVDIKQLSNFDAPFINIIDKENGVCYEVDKLSKQLKKYDSLVFFIDPDVKNTILPQNLFSFDLKLKGNIRFADSMSETNRPEINSFLTRDKINTIDITSHGSKYRQFFSTDKDNQNRMLEYIGYVDETVTNTVNWLNFKKIKGLSFEIPMMMINESFDQSGSLRKSKTVELIDLTIDNPIKTKADLEAYIKNSIDDSFAFLHYDATNKEAKLELPDVFK